MPKPSTGTERSPPHDQILFMLDASRSPYDGLVQPDRSDRYVAVFTAAIDRLTASIAGTLSDADIKPIVLKGATFARWLYPNEVRGYSDADLLVDPAEWERALDVVRALGFRDTLSGMAHPRMESQSSWALSRNFEEVDLHATLSGLAAPPQDVWRVLRERVEEFHLDGSPVLALDEPARVMHVALHAAHHRGNNKWREDLRRAIATAPAHAWATARDVALELGGGAAFAAGLQTLPEGVALARTLDVHHLRSVHAKLRNDGIPLAEALNELLTTPGLRPRLVMLRSELLPNTAFMRWNYPRARRGRMMLAASYPLRWLGLVAQLPRAMWVLVCARREARRT